MNLFTVLEWKTFHHWRLTKEWVCIKCNYMCLILKRYNLNMNTFQCRPWGLSVRPTRVRHERHCGALSAENKLNCVFMWPLRTNKTSTVGQSVTLQAPRGQTDSTHKHIHTDMGTHTWLWTCTFIRTHSHRHGPKYYNFSSQKGRRQKAA